MIDELSRNFLYEKFSWIDVQTNSVGFVVTASGLVIRLISAKEPAAT